MERDFLVPICGIDIDKDLLKFKKWIKISSIRL